MDLNFLFCSIFLQKLIYFYQVFLKKQKLNGEFFKEDLRGADVIFCWLTPKALPKLEYKFKNELKTGTRVIVFSSPLNFWPVEKEFEVNFEGIKFFGISIVPALKTATYTFIEKFKDKI
jgi:hypothetical protein